MDASARTFLRDDFDKGVSAAWLDAAPRGCSKCGARDWGSGSCNACGSHETPLILCTECKGSLEDRDVEYEARGSNGNRYRKLLPGDFCPICSIAYVYRMFSDDLDAFVESIPNDLQIIPEVGIQTSTALEVLVSLASEDAGSTLECGIESSEITGLRIEVGQQSNLFETCLDEITSYDTSDYGHEFSPTLRIYPGPPYGNDQRREIQLLISRLSLSTGAALTFWSVNFEPPGSDELSPLRKLREALEFWPLDQDRVCLALANNIGSDVEPSKFVNAFRLLETVVKRVLEQRIRSLRFDQNIDQDSFLGLVRVLQADLKTRLREAVKCKSADPTTILKEAWRVLQPGRGYKSDEAFEQLVKIRNQSVHSPAEPNEAILFPWEMKPLGKIAELVIQLASLLISEEEEARR